MNQFSLLCADIPLTITVQDSDYFNPASLEHISQKPSIKLKTIEINAVVKPRQDIDNYKADTPAVVSLSNDVLTITHPLYSGTYHIKRETGSASVHNSYGLMAFIRLLISVIITDYGGLAIHSSCILKNSKAHIFSGSSGNGKSTIIKLTENPLVYSDEVTLVRKDKTGYFRVYHSPFRSEFFTEPLPPADKIAGIYFLRQDTGAYLEALSQTDALIRLLPNIFFPVKERNPYEKKIFQLCCDFIRQVKPMVMHFKKDNSFWRYIDEQFSGLETEPGYGHQNY